MRCVASTPARISRGSPVVSDLIGFIMMLEGGTAWHSAASNTPRWLCLLRMEQSHMRAVNFMLSLWDLVRKFTIMR